MIPTELTNRKAPVIRGTNFTQNNYTVVYFYPRDNTSGCIIEAKEFSELLPQFQKLNTQVIGISKDTNESHDNFIEKQNLKIQLISDSDLKLQQKYKVWQEKKLGSRKYMGTARTTFLVHASGRIERVWEKVKPKGHAYEVLEYVAEAMHRPLSKKKKPEDK